MDQKTLMQILALAGSLYSMQAQFPALKAEIDEFIASLQRVARKADGTEFTDAEFRQACDDARSPWLRAAAYGEV